jgi:quercetin dioxygenase-like cupin family protein
MGKTKSQLGMKVEAMLRRTCVESEENLKHGETFRLDHRSRMIRVVSGKIWITWDGEDYILAEGETMMFPTGTEDAVISVLQEGESVFQLLCMPPEETAG